MQKKYFLVLASILFCLSPLDAHKSNETWQPKHQKATIQAPNNDDATDDASDAVLPEETPPESTTDDQASTEDATPNTDLCSNTN